MGRKTNSVDNPLSGTSNEIPHWRSCALFEFGRMNKMCFEVEKCHLLKMTLKITKSNKHYIQKNTA